MNQAIAEVAEAYMETEFVDTSIKNDVDRRTTRWIVFCGDRTPPEFKRTFDGMSLGGENLGHDYKTLAPSKGLLRRCQLTPMIVGHDDLNADSLGDDKGRYKSRSAYDAESRRNYTIYYNECLPGDELEGLMSANQGIFDYGIREVECLRGVEPPKKRGDGTLTECVALQYQKTIFPDWGKFQSGEMEFFKTDAELERYLRNRYEEVDDTSVRSIISVMLESLQQFERWATARLDEQGRLVKAQPTDGGRVHSWQPIHHQWFDQLELNKDEFLQKRREDAGARESNAPTKEEFNEMKQMFAAVMPAIGKLAEITVANQSGVKTEKRICTSVHQTTGNPCKAYVQGETDFCVNHQPKGE